MSESKHTPGPWFFGHVGTAALWIGPHYNKTPVAHVDHDMEYARDNSRANARLIAAAPDMYEALSDLIRLIENVAPDYSGCIAVANARAAIAKAEGARP
jgi:hypothetical protein